MNPLILAGIGVAIEVLVALLGWKIGDTIRLRRLAGKTLLIGVDKSRDDIELRYVKPKGNTLTWGSEKNGNMVYDGVVKPGEGSALTIGGSGRAFVINRQTLQTMRFSREADEIETAPEDGWQVGMYAVGVHERNIARPTGGSWLDTLASYTPIILIVLGVITIAGFAILGGKLGGKPGG